MNPLFEALKDAAESGLRDVVKALVQANHPSAVIPACAAFALAGDLEGLLEHAKEHGIKDAVFAHETRTCLHWACDVPRGTAVVEYYLSLGMKIEWTELLAAAHAGNIPLMQMLFEKGAKINIRHPTNGTTAVYVAARAGNVGVLKWLVEHKADINVAA